MRTGRDTELAYKSLGFYELGIVDGLTTVHRAESNPRSGDEGGADELDVGELRYGGCGLGGDEGKREIVVASVMSPRGSMDANDLPVPRHLGLRDRG